MWLFYLHRRDGVQAAGAGRASFGHHSGWGLSSLVHDITAVCYHGEDRLWQLLRNTPGMWKHDSKPCDIHKNKALNLFDFPGEIEATFHKKKLQNHLSKSYILLLKNLP